MTSCVRVLVSQTVKAFLPQMKAQNHGHIVTIASVLGLFSTACVEVNQGGRKKITATLTFDSFIVSHTQVRLINTHIQRHIPQKNSSLRRFEESYCKYLILVQTE